MKAESGILVSLWVMGCNMPNTSSVDTTSESGPIGTTSESGSESGEDECLLEWEPVLEQGCQSVGGLIGPPGDTTNSFHHGGYEVGIVVAADDAVHVLVSENDELNTGEVVTTKTHHVHRNGTWEEPVVRGGLGFELRLTVTGSNEFLSKDSRAIRWDDAGATVVYEGQAGMMVDLAGLPNDSGAWLLHRDIPAAPNLTLLAYDGADCVMPRWALAGCRVDTRPADMYLASNPAGEPVVAYVENSTLFISQPTRTPNTFVVPETISRLRLEDFEIDALGQMHICHPSPDYHAGPIVYEVGTDTGVWQTFPLDWGSEGASCRLAANPDGSEVWVVGVDVTTEGAWIARIADGAIERVIIDEDPNAWSVDVDLDTLGRPWVILYRHDPNTIDVAHWTGVDWAIESIHDIL